MIINTYTEPDLAALHAINVAGEPGVGAVSAERLAQIIAGGNCLVARKETGPVGFLLTLGPDADYDSPNYHWFDTRYESYVYVDRIAVAETARGQGIGAALYEAAFAQHQREALLIGCEVNSAPPNPGSMRFHERLGFAPVGEQAYAPDKAVHYLARRLVR